MKAAFLLLAILACATVPRGPHAPLKEAKEADVAGCRKIGRYSGSSSQPGDAGMSQAREEARSEAAAAGANTVVAERESGSPDSASAGVSAYDCP
jgi:hypothetical protein